jgi:hypothetical protein
MPIGKDSITKRVAKQTEEKIAPELVATTAAAPKTPAKKTSTASTAKKTTSTAAKKTTAAKKPATPKAEPVKETAVEEKKVDTAVLANVSPETVAAVIGHKEDEKYEKVQIGQKMPSFLL